MLRFEAKYGAPMLKMYIEMHDLHYSKEKLDDLLSASPSVLRRAMCSCFPEGTYYSLRRRESSSTGLRNQNSASGF